jgi:hypothetical protein
MPAVYAKHRDHAARPDFSTFVAMPDLAKEPDQGAVVSWPGRVGLLVSSAVKRGWAYCTLTQEKYLTLVMNEVESFCDSLGVALLLIVFAVSSA